MKGRPILPAGSLNKRIRIERNAAAKQFMGAGKNEWQLVANAWANIQDMPPSRADRIDDSLDILRRPTRIRLRFRKDITADMRIIYAGRTMEIVAGPIELGLREGVEILAQDSSTQGGQA